MVCSYGLGKIVLYSFTPTGSLPAETAERFNCPADPVPDYLTASTWLHGPSLTHVMRKES